MITKLKVSSSSVNHDGCGATVKGLHPVIDTFPAGEGYIDIRLNYGGKQDFIPFYNND